MSALWCIVAAKYQQCAHLACLRWRAANGARRNTHRRTQLQFRHNDRLVTFMPEAKVVRVKSGANGGFPEVLKPGVGSIPEFYAVKAWAAERIAGLDADVVQLVPKDRVALWLSHLDREKNQSGAQSSKP